MHKLSNKYKRIALFYTDALDDIWQKLHIKSYVVDLQRDKTPHREPDAPMLRAPGVAAIFQSHTKAKGRGAEAFRIL